MDNTFNMSGGRNWQQDYEEGTAPWDTGRPSTELRRFIEGDECLVRPAGRVLDIGCGTGTHTLYLAERGFEVTGIEAAEGALEVARERAGEAGVDIDFRLGDVLEAGGGEERFDFIFDRGCFHTFQGEAAASRYVAMLGRVSRPGTVYLMLSGNPREVSEGGPPVLSEGQIRERLEPLFEIESIREFRFDRKEEEDGDGTPGPLGFACVMSRREV
jgi:SAM-dependent methyltransferase